MTGSAAPAPPAVAAAVFGERLPQAVRYAELLCTTGVERGLLGPREPERIWERHLLNSAVLADAIAAGARVTDVGSGAGLPGVPLAIARPDLVMRLVEPMARRHAFLEEVVAALSLDVVVVRARGEDLAPGSADVVVARAVAPLSRLLPLTLPLVSPEGTLLALKGNSATAELASAAPLLQRWPTARASITTVGPNGVKARVVRVDIHRVANAVEERR